MPILKNLTFTAVPARSHDPGPNRRAKLVERTVQNLAMAVSRIVRGCPGDRLLLPSAEAQ
jgi:hypothetical protein